MKNLLLFRPNISVVRRFLDSFPNSNLVLVSEKKIFPEKFSAGFAGGFSQIQGNFLDCEYFEQLLEDLFVDFGDFHGIILFLNSCSNNFGESIEGRLLQEMVRKCFETDLMILHGILPYLRNREPIKLFVFAQNFAQEKDFDTYHYGFRQGFYSLVQAFREKETKLQSSLTWVEDGLSGGKIEDLIQAVCCERRKQTS